MQLHSVTKTLSRALVLLALVAFSASAFAQQRYVITNGDAVKRDHAYVGDKFLAIDYNGTTPRLTVADQFDTNCIWYCNGKPGFYYQLSSNGDRYYLDRTGSTLGLLTVRMGHGEVFESATQWYDWTFGVATQELAGDARYYWVILNADGNSWGLSCDTYGRPGINNGDETNGHSNTATCAQYYADGTTPMVAATYTPLQAVEHAAGVPTAEAGGLLNATLTADNVINNGGSISATVTGITAYSSTVVPAYTEYRLRTITPASQYANFPEGIDAGTTPDDYMLSGGTWYYHLGTAATHYYYAGAMHTAAPTQNSDARTIVSKEWTLSGDGARYLAVTPTGDTTQATVTTTGTWNRAMTATLTYTVTYSDGRSQQLQQEITLNIVPTAVALSESEFDITVGEEATFGYTLTPSGAVVVPTVSWTPEANAPTATLNNNVYTINNTATPGTYTMTVTAAAGITATATVRVHPAAPTAIAFGSDVVSGITAADGTTIYYTTDASVNLLTAGTGTAFSGTPAVEPGQTVYAVAEQDGLRSLSVFSARYSGPATGTNQNLGDGNLAVVLNDLEDHSWSYYSDPASPIRSLNPADVKITYYGNGQTNNNMTTTDVNDVPTAFGAKATGVRVGIASSETENTFVYYKTLERANGNAGTGNLAYTTIPNPFQVRPTGQDNGSQAVYSSTRTVQVSVGTTTNYYDWPGNNYYVTISYGGVSEQIYGVNYWGGWTHGTNTQAYDIPVGTEVTIRWNGGNNSRNRCRVSVGYDNSTTNILSTTTPTSNSYVMTTFTVQASPTTVTAGQYRGFYAWRIKSLSDGLTINGKSVGDIVNAEEAIEFATTNEYGNEVEFEALWAQAYVQSGTSNLSYAVSGIPSAYERNFHVLSGNANASAVQQSYPHTVTSRYPNDAATNFTKRQVSGAFTAAGDTKFEDVTLSATNNTYTANGYDLIVGRGVTGTVNYLNAAGSNTNGAMNGRKLRVESGKYNFLSFFGGYQNISGSDVGGGTVSGTMNLHAVLGCDYDRVNNNGITDNLEIVYNVSYSQALTISNNTANETLKAWIKSGKIGSYWFKTNTSNNNRIGQTGYVAAGEQSIYLSNANSNYQQVGKRRLTIEGGQIQSIAGGVDRQNNASDTSISIRIKGGVVEGSVYGAAAFAETKGHRKFVFTGGAIRGWLAGGCNGTTSTQNVSGVLDGNTYMYIGGDCEVGFKDGTAQVTINASEGGHIFGAGSGNSLVVNGTTQEQTRYATVGQVNNSTVIIADEAYVQQNVYGGGNFGYVTTNGLSDIRLYGNSVVNGNVFGGANQRFGSDVQISLKGGTVNGSVYGGSNITGTINDGVIINLLGGTVNGSVYGGGKGNPTRVTKNVSVTVGGDAKVVTDVYGGSEEGVVNSTMASPSATTANQTNNSYTTKVDVKGNANVKGNVYGGGYGTATSYAHVAGDVTVTVSEDAVIDGAVFGCNNANGRPLGKVNVNIAGGTMGNVYGGGNQAAYGRSGANAVEAPHVLMTNGHVLNNVFGGGLGSTAVIYQDTDVKVQAGVVDGNVYGGGAKANVTGNTNVVIGK